MAVVVHDARVAEAFPAHAVAAVRVRSDEALRPAGDAVATLRAAVAAEGGLEPARAAAPCWRDVYDRLGAKPKYRSSVGLLLELYEERGGVPAPVPLVELYCWYSLAHGVPMAGYSTQAIVGELRLTIPGKGVPFTPMGRASAQLERTRSGEVAYVDDEKCVCRYWNCRDCDQTKLGAEVHDALFVFDLVDAPGLPGRAQAERLIAGFAGLLDGLGSIEGGLVAPRAV